MRHARALFAVAYGLAGVLTVHLVGTASGADLFPVRTLVYVLLAATAVAAGILLRSAWWAGVPALCATGWLAVDALTGSALNRAAGVDPLLFPATAVASGLGLGLLHLVTCALRRAPAGS